MSVFSTGEIFVNQIMSRMSLPDYGQGSIEFSDAGINYKMIYYSSGDADHRGLERISFKLLNTDINILMFRFTFNIKFVQDDDGYHIPTLVDKDEEETLLTPIDSTDLRLFEHLVSIIVLTVPRTFTNDWRYF